MNLIPLSVVPTAPALPARRRRHVASGFTVIELVVTMTVAAILVAVGVPAMSSFIQNGRSSNEAASMVLMLTFARNEALKRDVATGVTVSGGLLAAGGTLGVTGTTITQSAGTIAALAEHQGLETRKLEAVLQRLSRAGLLKSVRGPSGGYLIAGEKSAITVAMITRAVLGGDLPVPLEQSPSATMRKVVLPLVERFHQNMLADMAGVSLADLCRLSRLAGLKSACDGIVDFVI